MRTRLLAFAALTATLTAAERGDAQCVGDCNSDATVAVNELVTGVNISLGAAPLAACTVIDANGDGSVAINELILGVNNALNGCATGPTTTPTPTRTSVASTPTPTPTEVGGTPTPTPTVPTGCGNLVVDFDLGETCDDGNTVDGDDCPANCRIATCEPTGETLDVDLRFTPPAGRDLAGITVFLRYPESSVRIPGAGSSDQVFGRLVYLPDNAFATPNDLDYALRLVAFAPDLSPIAPPLLATIQFDRCAGGPAPSAGAFGCRVEDAADVEENSVAGTTCTITLP